MSLFNYYKKLAFFAIFLSIAGSLLGSSSRTEHKIPTLQILTCNVLSEHNTPIKGKYTGLYENTNLKPYLTAVKKKAVEEAKMSLGHGEFYLNINQIFHPGGPWNYSENKLASSLLSCTKSCSRLIKKIGITKPIEANLCCSTCPKIFYFLIITPPCHLLLQKTDQPFFLLPIFAGAIIPNTLQTWLQNYLLNPKTWHTKKTKPIIMTENDEDNNSSSVDERYKQHSSSEYATSGNVKNFPIQKMKED